MPTANTLEDKSSELNRDHEGGGKDSFPLVASFESILEAITPIRQVKGIKIMRKEIKLSLLRDATSFMQEMERN